MGAIEDLKDSEAGDFVDEGIDQLVMDLNEDGEPSGIKADYENLYSGGAGYLAELSLNGRVVAVMGTLGGSPMFREVRSQVISEIQAESTKDRDSDLEKMMDKEGFTSLEFDKGYNTLTIVDGSGGDVKVTISLDLIREFEREAEKSEEEIFKVGE